MRWLGALIIMLGALPACGGADPDRSLDDSGLRGRVLSSPLPKVDFTLTSHEGRPFHFLEETSGFVTLLFFGYTYCPDVCPIHMASIAAVLEQLPPSVADRFKVVFVTTDAARDTPERLREWLGSFSHDFIGLTGPLEEVNRIQQEIGLAQSFREDLPDGGYGMAHAAQVLAYTLDDLAHVAYPFGTRQADWAHDLPILAQAP